MEFLSKDALESTKERRVYMVYLKAAADIQNHIKIKAIIGEHGGDDSIYINKSVLKTGFAIGTHRLFAAICGTIGELIKPMEFSGNVIKYYAIAATREKVITHDDEETYGPYPVDVYFIQASNREELLANEEFKKICSISDYKDEDGNFKGIAYGIGEFNSNTVNAAGLLNKVYHTKVGMNKHPDFMIYGDRDLPKPDAYSHEYEKAAIEVLNNDYLSRYIVFVTDAPKEL